MKRSERKNVDREEQTDTRLLELYRRLPVNEQREFFRHIMEQTRDQDRVIAFSEILSDPEILEEVQRLARGAAVPVQKLAQVVNPFQYSSYFARSSRCTMAKLTSVDDSRFAEVAEVIVFVKVYKDVQFRHTIIPVGFDLHVQNGELEIHRGTIVARTGRGRVATVDAGGEVTIRARAGCWFNYSDHPLTAWIRQRAQQKRD